MRYIVRALAFSVVIFSLYRCAAPGGGESGFVENPPAEGFDIENSDPQAIKIADDVMAAMGGRKSWDETRYITWNFFGSRKHLWDKYTDDIRIESARDSTVILMNINTMEGRVMKKGQEFTNADSLTKYLDRGKAWWINDAYWLLMPYKLKDSGVTLSYLREDTTMDGRSAHVLGLKFENVGVTPDNGYEVFVDIEKRLVTQWAYYRDAYQEAPNFVMPWLDYQQHGKILLSGNRGERQIRDIAVLETVPGEAFKSFDKIQL